MRKSEVIEHFGGVSKTQVFLVFPTRQFADGVKSSLKNKHSSSNELRKAS